MKSDSTSKSVIMKRTFIITAILVLLSTFTFGQNIRSEFKNELIPSSAQKLDSVITKNYSEDGLFIYKYDYVYHPTTGDMVVQTHSDWNGVFWEPDTKGVFTYDGFHNLIQIDYYEGDALNFEYEVSVRFENTHNVFGELVQILQYQRWEPLNMEKLTGKLEYSYSLDGKLEKLVLYSWDYLEDTDEKGWEPLSERNYTYDLHGNMTQLIYRDGDHYQDYEKRKYVYDANDNLIQEMVYGQDENGNDFLAGVINFTYDNSYSDIIHPYCFYYEEDLLYNHMLIKMDCEGDSATFYYSEQKANSVVVNSLVPVTVYPNPASDYIHVDACFADNDGIALKIFTGNGVMVRSEMLKQRNSRINIEDLSNGIYLLEIKSPEWVKKQKLIINR